MTALLDTGFLIATLSRRDRLHEKCIRQYVKERNRLLPSPVLTELAYMLTSRGERFVFTNFLEQLAQGEPRLVFPQPDDLRRAKQLMETYADAKIDFVDCAIVAIAERLNIERILTVDQRDFRMVRPRHTAAFTILPS